MPDYLLPAVIQVETKTVASSEDMTFFVSNEIERQDERLLEIDPSGLEKKLMDLLFEKANGM